ncbi:hypothetical protein M407DRAFT_217538, partial [Tulasnella calospora MUT 4182]
IWEGLSHPNVLELLGYYLSPEYDIARLISPCLINGNVSDYLKRAPVTVAQRLEFVRDITAGLDYLHNHSPPICHSDLNPANILIDDNLHAVLSGFGLAQANVLIDLHMNAILCDFGLASFVSGSDTLPGLVTTTTLKGTPRYMGPELLEDGDCKHSLESDIWAWARTVFQILTGRIPYAEAAGEVPFYMAIYQKNLPGDVKHLLSKIPEGADSESALALRFLYSTLPQCWDFDPHKRPSISTLLSQLPLQTNTINEGDSESREEEIEIKQDTVDNGGGGKPRIFDGNHMETSGPQAQVPSGGDTPSPPSVGCRYPECNVKRVSKNCSSSMCPRHCRQNGSSCRIHGLGAISSPPPKRGGENLDEEPPSKRARYLIEERR